MHDVVPNNHNGINKLSFYSPTEGYVAFNKWIGYTVDSGRSYSARLITLNNVDFTGYSVNLTFGFGITGVKAFDKNNIVVYGDYGFVPAILRSNNGGSTFKLVYQSQIISSEIKDLVFPENNNIGYAIDDAKILKSSDGGATWNVIRNDVTTYFNFLEAIDNNNVFAFSTNYSRKLLRTSNAGLSWQEIKVPSLTGGRIQYAHFINTSTGWLNMEDYNQKGYIYYTSDGGNNWILQNDPDVNGYLFGKMKFVNDSTGYALGGLFTVFKTTDTGRVWERLPRTINAIHLGYSHKDLQCWTENQLWAGGGDESWLELSTNGGGTPLPAAYFKIDTTNSYLNQVVNLVNRSAKNYQYEWFVNKVLISNNYQTSYTHDVYHPIDTIMLVVKNGNLTDTLIKTQNVGPIPKPKIISFSPTSGTLGSTITISGTYLKNASFVSFGNFPVTSFTVVSPNTVTAVLGEGGSGLIHLTTPGGKDSVPGFTYIPPPPVITSVSPLEAIAGSIIKISGNFFNNATAVSFGGIPAASFKVLSQWQIEAIIGAGASGTIEVTTQTGTGTITGFKLIPPITITSFSPQSGPIGTSVTITGNNFNPNTYDNVVYFGGVKTNIVTASSTSLTVTVPPGAIYLPITVTTNGQTVSSAGIFNPTFPGADTITSSSFQNVGTYNTAPDQYTHCASMGDIDGDGKLDIVTTTVTLSVFRNTTTGNNITLAPRIDIPTKYGAITNILRDMNADGKLDIIAGSFGPGIAKNTSTLGSISFDTMIFLPTTMSNALGLAVADIDGDGRPDIAQSKQHIDKASVYRNTSQNGNLSFEPEILIAAGDDPWGVELADVDGDNKPELIVVNYYGTNVSVYRNTSTPGSISFASPINFPSASRGITATDLDGDGKIDLAVTYFNNSNQVALLRNTSSGPGNISFALTYLPGKDPFSIQAADINGDNKPDLVTPNQSGQTVSIYINTSTPGNMSFKPPVNYAIGLNSYPRSAPIGDLDNDTKPDFLYVNHIVQSFSIFRNRINESLNLAGRDTSICIGDSLKLGTAPIAGNVYNWTSNAGNFSSTSANPTVKPATNTVYYLTVTNNGQSFYDTVIVVVKPLPIADAGPDKNICAGTSISIGSPLTSGYTYIWTSSTGTFTPSMATPTVSPTINTSYYLTVSTNGCILKDTVSIFVKPTPPPPVITQNGKDLISSSLLGNQWYTNGQAIAGATAQTFTPATSGFYTVRVTENGCVSSASNEFGFVITAINVPYFDSAILIMPNPVVSRLYIQNRGNLTKLKIIVRDLTGRLLKEQVMSNSISEIDMIGFSNGIYFIEVIELRKGIFSRRMIMKQ